MYNLIGKRKLGKKEKFIKFYVFNLLSNLLKFNLLKIICWPYISTIAIERKEKPMGLNFQRKFQGIIRV